MLQSAEKLSSPFDFVRVDFYENDGAVLFGELTFHPDSGNAPFSDYESDLYFGRLFGSDVKGD